MQYGDEHGWFFVYINVICRMYGKSVPLREIIQVQTLSKKHSFSAIYLSIYRNFTNITQKGCFFAAKYDIMFVVRTLYHDLIVPIFVKERYRKNKSCGSFMDSQKELQTAAEWRDVCLKIKR